MNKGVSAARGDVIGWLNADDRYHPGALRAVGEALAAAPRRAVGHRALPDHRRRRGSEIRRGVTAYKNAFLRRYSLRPLPDAELHLGAGHVPAPRAFETVGLFDERYRISMDYDLYLRLARRADPLILDRYLSDFRMVEGTLSMSGFETQFREHAEQARRHGHDHPFAVDRQPGHQPRDRAGLPRDARGAAAGRPRRLTRADPGGGSSSGGSSSGGGGGGSPCMCVTARVPS